MRLDLTVPCPPGAEARLQPRASTAPRAEIHRADGYGLDGPRARAALARPQVTVLRGRRVPGCQAFQRDDLWACDFFGSSEVPFTDATRTLCDLGAVAPPDLVGRALESMLRRDLTSVPALENTIDRLCRRGRAGPSVLDGILLRRGSAPPTESDAETVFLQVVRHPDRPDPTRQLPLLVDGRVVHRIDFAYDWPWLAAPVWVEIDGISTHDGWKR